jgi:hypothetical protein
VLDPVLQTPIIAQMIAILFKKKKKVPEIHTSPPSVVQEFEFLA